MQHANLYQQYKTQSLETLTKGEVVVKLFEEASKQISMGIFFANNGNAFKSYNCITKAQKIIQTLEFSLDMRHAISIELKDMYLFLHAQLGKAAGEKDVELLKELLSLVDDLKTTFRQAEKLARVRR
jgi:flagellar protein FliS